MRSVPSTVPPRPARWWCAFLLSLVVLVGSGIPAAGDPAPLGPAPDPIVPGRAADLGVDVTYSMPAAGRIRRGFAAPRSAFAAGHRGVDVELPIGAEVLAAATGQVVFAGPVAGRQWLSIAHADGVVTTYGPVTDLQVRTGEAVLRGQRVASLAPGGHGTGGRDEGLHWGARDRAGGRIDPLRLLSVGRARPALVGSGHWVGTGHVVEPYDPWSGGRLGELFVASSPEAVDAGFAAPPNPNHVVFLAGLASSSDSEVLDAEHLGYDPRSVTAFSYAGRDPGREEETDPRRDQRPYGPSDTWEGTGPAAARLAEQLRAQAAREPGRAVDLIGHSMGGVVIVRYLLEHHDPYDRTLPPIGHVVTIGAPLRGSDPAVLGQVLDDDILFDGFGERDRHRTHPGADVLPLSAPAIDELARGSEQLRELGQAWDQVRGDPAAGPFAMGTRMLTIGGSRDLVVTPYRAQQPTDEVLTPVPDGSVEVDGRTRIDHRVLPGGHSSVLETEAVREVTWRFLAGEEVTSGAGHLPSFFGRELGHGIAGGALALKLWGLWRAPFGRIGRAAPR
ncbi:MAG: peptidoglycan DD-metalloendopeptidase family protein [Nitriliruptoraceae bacterium]